MVSFSRAILVYHQTNISDTKWNPAYTSYNFIMFGTLDIVLLWRLGTSVVHRDNVFVFGLV